MGEPQDYSKTAEVSASTEATLLSDVEALIGKLDRLEDNNHNAAETAKGIYAKDVFSQAGTTYGICAEELRILVARHR